MIECMESILKSTLRHINFTHSQNSPRSTSIWSAMFSKYISHITCVSMSNIVYSIWNITKRMLRSNGSNVVVKRVTLMDCQLVNNSSRCEIQTTTSPNSFLFCFMLYAYNTSNKMTSIPFCLYLFLFCWYLLTFLNSVNL